MSALTPEQIERLAWTIHHAGCGAKEPCGTCLDDAYEIAPVVAALIAEAVDQARAEERERIAAAIESGYLGPDFGRQYDGRESPDARLHDAYDEGLESAARIARSQP